MNFNQVIFAGHITRDLEIKTVNATTVVKFAVANNRKWKDKTTNAVHEEATFLDVEMWGKPAESIGKLAMKGSPVLVQGRLQMEQWKDKDTGKNRSRLIMVADHWQFTEAKKDSAGKTTPPAPSNEGAPPAAPAGGQGGEPDDEVPF